MDYITGSGVRFNFNGFAAGNSPLECFDSGRYVECLHGCMVQVYLFAENKTEYLADDGLLHELVHLIQGIDICTHNSMDNIREQIKGLISAGHKTQETEPV